MATLPTLDSVEMFQNLKLEEGSIDPSLLSMGTLTRELNLGRQSPWILRKLMTGLENQRVARKLGWSRPWNKQDMNIFRSMKGSRDGNGKLLEKLKKWISPFIESSPLYFEFVDELLSDPKLMVFFFFHNRQEGNSLYEGVTISLGRKVADDPSKRDRLDLILEDKREWMHVDGVIDRVNLYVNPWFDHRFDRQIHREITVKENIQSSVLQGMYTDCCDVYSLGKDDPIQQFEHWSIRFIDYFGPRVWIPKGTRFL